MNAKVPKKKVVQINESQLPEIFKAYWEGRISEHEPLRRDYEFFLVDGELYYREKEQDLLSHWTKANCCGIALYVSYLRKKKIPFVSKDEIVRDNGEYLFILSFGEYECIATSPVDGKSFTVYSG